MIKIKKNIFTLTALFLVISLIAITFAGRGHSLKVDLFRSGQGWGYDILKNNKIYIHQPFMPAVEGQVPFQDRRSARKTGLLVVKKLKNRKSPSVTIEELKPLIGN